MRLVLQGIDNPQQLRHLAALNGNTPPAALDACAYSFSSDGRHREQISAYCLEQGIDCAWVPESLDLDHIGLVVMDMDSTLIAIETIDEIADLQGMKPQVAAITEQAMRGEIDYAASLSQRVALLAGLDEAALLEVYAERLRLNPGAEWLLAELRWRGIKTLLVSGGFSFFTERLKDRLGLDYAVANRLEIVAGKLTGKVLGEIIDAQAKADWLSKIRGELGLAPEQVLAIGDGANDLRMLAAAGYGIAYHAKPLVRAQADCALNFAGLDGVLRLFAGHPAHLEAQGLSCALEAA
jgi:phosphoserine phosphatase